LAGAGQSRALLRGLSCTTCGARAGRERRVVVVQHARARSPPLSFVWCGTPHRSAPGHQATSRLCHTHQVRTDANADAGAASTHLPARGRALTVSRRARKARGVARSSTSADTRASCRRPACPEAQPCQLVLRLLGVSLHGSKGRCQESNERAALPNKAGGNALLRRRQPPQPRTAPCALLCSARRREREA
jgi:hypothetical protein